MGLTDQEREQRLRRARRRGRRGTSRGRGTTAPTAETPDPGLDLSALRAHFDTWRLG